MSPTPVPGVDTPATPAAAAPFPDGTVVSYRPDPARHDPQWCREGTAIADHTGTLYDTYWRTGDKHQLLPAEVETAEALFNLHDYRRLESYEADTWRSYHPDDRQVVTHQHRLVRDLYVRVGASTDLDTQIADAEEAIRAGEAAVRLAEHDLELRQQKLAELVARRQQ